MWTFEFCLKEGEPWTASKLRFGTPHEAAASAARWMAASIENEIIVRTRLKKV